MEDASARQANERVIITCACGQKMKVPAEARGKRYKCVKCGAQLTVEESAPLSVPQGAGASGVPVRGGAAGPERIGQMLIRAGLVTREQLEEALDRQRAEGGKTFEILVRLGHLDKDALHEFLSKQPGIATIKLSNYKLERDLVELIPKELALREKVLPIDRLGKLLTIAMACPTDVETVEEIQRVTGLKVKAMLCRLDDIEEAVERLYRKGRAASAEAQLFERILASEPEQPKPEAVAARKPAAPPPPGKAPEPVTPPRAQVADAELKPGTVRRFIALAEDPNSTTRDLARAAQEDAALSAVLLRAANSGLYGLTEQVESAAMAVVLMGKEGVAELLKAAFE